MAETTNLTSGDKSDQRTADAIRQDIAARRESISGTVDRLGERVQDTFDWRIYVGRYPLTAMGLVVGAGFAISAVFKRRPSPRDRIIEALAEMVEDITDRFRGNLDDVTKQKHSRAGSAIKAGIGGIVTTALSQLVRQKLNGTAQRMGAEPKVESGALRGDVANQYSTAGYVGH